MTLTRTLTLSAAAAALMLAGITTGAMAQPSELPGPMELEQEEGDVQVTEGTLYERTGTSANCQSFNATQTTTITGATVVVNPSGGTVPGLTQFFGSPGGTTVGAPVKTSTNLGVVTCASVGVPTGTNSLFVPSS